MYYKLAFFSVALFAAPLTAYYVSIDRFFEGNPNYAGGLAALVANLVLVGYVTVAFLEDQGSAAPALKKEATREELRARLQQMDKEEESRKDQ